MKTKKKKIERDIKNARVYIKSSFNNSLISATDEKGNVFAWSSTGNAGFKGSKKSTPYAATQAARIVIDKIRAANVETINLIVSGVSAGRDAAVRAFSSSGIRINSVKDKTPIPHNGCRAKKPRRV